MTDHLSRKSKLQGKVIIEVIYNKKERLTAKHIRIHINNGYYELQHILGFQSIQLEGCTVYNIFQV